MLQVSRKLVRCNPHKHPHIPTWTKENWPQPVTERTGVSKERSSDCCPYTAFQSFQSFQICCAPFLLPSEIPTDSAKVSLKLAKRPRAKAADCWIEATLSKSNGLPFINLVNLVKFRRRIFTLLGNFGLEKKSGKFSNGTLLEVFGIRRGCCQA